MVSEFDGIVLRIGFFTSVAPVPESVDACSSPDPEGQRRSGEAAGDHFDRLIEGADGPACKIDGVSARGWRSSGIRWIPQKPV